MSAIRELVDKYLANGLADFKGLHVSGTIPIHEDVINELITGFVKGDLSHEKHSNPQRSHTTESQAHMSELLKLVQKLEVKASDGKVIVDFELRV